MSEEESKYCQFSQLPGLDRILRAQDHPKAVKEGTTYSLPFQKEHKDDSSNKDDSCNIVVVGPPGTGKSTLALDMAAKLRLAVLDDENNPSNTPEPISVLYYGLEQSRQSLLEKGEKIALEEAVWIEGPTNELKASFPESNICKNENDGEDKIKNRNYVFFPSLSPRPLEQVEISSHDHEQKKSIFWQRYSEIRHIIDNFNNKKDIKFEGMEEQNNDLKECKQIPQLRMVIIDSLNVFADQPITRYLIEHLFSLFAEKNIIGVFISDDPDERVPTVTGKPLVSPGIINLADVVLRLGWEEDEGYTFRNIEVVKSRHTPNMYGKQHMKIRDKGIQILPSLHSWYTFLRSTKEVRGTEGLTINDKLNWFTGYDKETSLLDVDPASKTNVVHLVSGPKKNKKSEIAFHYAATPRNATQVDKPDDKDTKSNFLLVNFDESLNNILESSASTNFGQVQSIKFTNKDLLFTDLISRSKGELRQLEAGNCIGYELWLTPGHLLSEEFLYYLYQIIRDDEFKIGRVILRDIGELHMRHPIMAKHILSGKSNYLPALLELFRVFNVDSFFVCTTEEDDEDARKICRSIAQAAHIHIHPKAEDMRLFSGPNWPKRLCRLLSNTAHLSTPANQNNNDPIDFTWSGRFRKRSDNKITIDGHSSG